MNILRKYLYDILQFLLLYKFLMLYLSFFKLSVTISEEKIYLIAKIYL